VMVKVLRSSIQSSGDSVCGDSVTGFHIVS